MVQRDLRFLAIGLRADGRSWVLNRLIQWAQGIASSTFDRGELKYAASQQERCSKAKHDQRNGRQTGETLQSSSCSMSSTQPSAA